MIDPSFWVTAAQTTLGGEFGRVEEEQRDRKHRRGVHGLQASEEELLGLPGGKSSKDRRSRASSQKRGTGSSTWAAPGPWRTCLQKVSNSLSARTTSPSSVASQCMRNQSARTRFSRPRLVSSSQ